MTSRHHGPPKHKQPTTVEINYGIFWDEYRSIELSKPQLPQTPDSEDGVERKEDHNENSIQWLNDVGFKNIAKKIRESTEIDQNDDDMKMIAASLTRAQANAVRRRIDSLNEAIRLRKLEPENPLPSKIQVASKRRDVRNIFSNNVKTKGETTESQFNTNAMRNRIPTPASQSNTNTKRYSNFGISEDKDVSPPPPTAPKPLHHRYSSSFPTMDSQPNEQVQPFLKADKRLNGHQRGSSSPTLQRLRNSTPQLDNLVRRTSDASHLILRSAEERERSLSLAPTENVKSSNTIEIRRPQSELIASHYPPEDHNIEPLVPIMEKIGMYERNRKTSLHEECPTDYRKLSHRKSLSSDHIASNDIQVKQAYKSLDNVANPIQVNSSKKLVVIDSKYIHVGTHSEDTKPVVEIHRNKPAAETNRNKPAAETNRNKPAAETNRNKPVAETNQNKPAVETHRNELVSEIDCTKPVTEKHDTKPLIETQHTVKSNNKHQVVNNTKKVKLNVEQNKPVESNVNNTQRVRVASQPQAVLKNRSNVKVLSKTQSSPVQTKKHNNSSPATESKVDSKAMSTSSEDSKSVSSLGSLGSIDDLVPDMKTKNLNSNENMSQVSSYSDRSIDSCSPGSTPVTSPRIDSPRMDSPRINETSASESPRTRNTAGLEGDAKLNVGSTTPRDVPETVNGPSFPPLPNFTLAKEELGMTTIGDLSEEDMVKVRSLALIELTALFDTYTIPMNRKKAPSKLKFKDNGVFGVPLTVLCQREQNKKNPVLKPPRIFCEMLKYIECNGLHEEGLLRVPGSSPRVKAFREEADKNDLSQIRWDNKKISDISTCLKQFLRDLPIPLLSQEYQNTFTSVGDLPDRKVQLQALNLLVLLLHPVHQETLKLLLVFLSKIVAKEGENKMGLNNVAMIMAPNLFFHNNATKINIDEAQKAAKMTDIMRMLIKYQKILWTVPSFMVSQIRFLYEEGPKTINPKNVRKIITKRMKSDNLVVRGKSSGSSGEELDENSDENLIIRVKAPSLNKQSMAIQLTDKSTASDVIAKFQWRRQHSVKEKDEIDTSRLKIMKSRKDKKEKEKARDIEFYLCESGGNIGERRLEPSTNLSAILKVNPNVEWVLKGRLRK